MNRATNNRSLPAVLTAVSLFFAVAATAQSFRGSIRGKVTDPSGSVIAGAKVSAKNTGTGLIREATTGDDGGYVFTGIPAGGDTLPAQAPGLSPAGVNVQGNAGLDTPPHFDLAKVGKRQKRVDGPAESALI